MEVLALVTFYIIYFTLLSKIRDIIFEDISSTLMILS
jgi:hypothetical protein